MWFWSRHLPGRELRTDPATYSASSLASAAGDGAAASQSAADSFRDTPGTEANTTTTPNELPVPHRRIRKLTTPYRGLTGDLALGTGPKNQVNSAFNRLRAQIFKRIQDNGWNTIAVTSPSRSSGNTLTAINLALSIARDYRYTVLLVELDLINPSFREVLGFKQKRGIVDYLLHDVPIQDILLSPGIDRLVVIPAGSPVSDSSELLASPKMTQLVAELKLRFEHGIVLFDLPPVLETDDAMAFAPFVDCALLVVEEGETLVNDVRRALDDLGSTKILGVVLNRSIHVAKDGKIVSR